MSDGNIQASHKTKKWILLKTTLTSYHANTQQDCHKIKSHGLIMTHFK